MENDSPQIIEWSSPQLDQAALDANLEEAARLKAEYDVTRDYVLTNFKKLRGTMIPIEVLGIQNLPGHNCLILNDMLLLPYTEAEHILRSFEDDRDSV
jgi:hypothetical protein